jgi:prepilin-type processing-associated H-X9-DG protein
MIFEKDETRKDVILKIRKFTIIELLVVVSIISILTGILLPALNMARKSARGVTCKNNLKQLGLAFNMYINDYDGTYPSARWKTGSKLRWQNSIGNFIGGSVLDPGVGSDPKDSTATLDNIIINESFKCPETKNSLNQIPTGALTNSTGNRGNYLRTGSYGYNWATFGPFTILGGITTTRRFPVKPNMIRKISSTIMVADSFGEYNMSGSRPHAYTLDGPKQMSGRWGTSGTQTPADPRHLGQKFNAAMGDGHVEEFSFAKAGYDANVPQSLGQSGSLKYWNGYGEPDRTFSP